MFSHINSDALSAFHCFQYKHEHFQQSLNRIKKQLETLDIRGELLQSHGGLAKFADITLPN